MHIVKFVATITMWTQRAFGLLLFPSLNSSRRSTLVSWRAIRSQGHPPVLASRIFVFQRKASAPIEVPAGFFGLEVSFERDGDCHASNGCNGIDLGVAGIGAGVCWSWSWRWSSCGGGDWW